MRQSFKDLAKEDWQKKKLHYEALIRTDSYRRLVDKTITKWAKAKNKAFKEWAKAENIDLNRCKLATARERFFAEPNLEASLLANELDIDYLFDPDKELPEVAGLMKAVRSIRRQAAKFYIEETPPDPGPKLRPFGSKISPPLKKESVPLEPFKKDGRYLLVEIDLKAPKKRIFTEIEFLIEIHRATIETEIPKRGLTDDQDDLSPFKIYDMNKSGKKLSHITRELNPNLKNTKNLTDDARSDYSKIYRLNKMAKKLIEEAESKIPKTLKLRLLRNSNVEKKDQGPI